LTDLAAVRAILDRDRVWSVYALGDLAPQHLPHCRWIAAGNGLALLYREFEPPIFFFTGGPGEARDVLVSLDVTQMYLHVKPEIVPVISPLYTISHLTPMWRMALDTWHFRPERTHSAEMLGPHDLASLEKLYSDGLETGEAPYFFFPSMLETGVFSGIRVADELVAVAGTHLVNSEDGAAAVGNIYTRRDHRGQGLAGSATSAVVEQLIRMGISTIALNVKQDNPGARRVYERLGFFLHCDFVEGVARR